MRRNNSGPRVDKSLYTHINIQGVERTFNGEHVTDNGKSCGKNKVTLAGKGQDEWTLDGLRIASQASPVGMPWGKLTYLPPSSIRTKRLESSGGQTSTGPWWCRENESSMQSRGAIEA